MLDNNEVICPYCLEKTELSPSDEEYIDEPMFYCRNCDGEFEGLADARHDFWYEFNEEHFARHFLKLRGYEGIPKSWYAVGCYMKHFLNGNRKKVDVWKDEQWQEAYEIISKYFDIELELD